MRSGRYFALQSYAPSEYDVAELQCGSMHANRETNMARTAMCSFAGAAIGILLAFIMVHIASGGMPGSDTAAITLFVGTFLAGTGAIAGAVVGGMAEYLNRADQVIETRAERDS
jgi:hypothetical protein